MQVYSTKVRNQLYSRMGLSNLPLGQCFAHEGEAEGSGLFQEHRRVQMSDCMCECMVIQVHNYFMNTYQWCTNIKHTMRWAGSFWNHLCMVEKWYVRRGSHTMSAYILDILPVDWCH